MAEARRGIFFFFVVAAIVPDLTSCVRAGNGASTVAHIVEESEAAVEAAIHAGDPEGHNVGEAPTTDASAGA